MHVAPPLLLLCRTSHSIFPTTEIETKTFFFFAKPMQAMGCRADPETRERLRGEYFLCGVSRDRGLGAFGFVDEELARKLAEQPSL